MTRIKVQMCNCKACKKQWKPHGFPLRTWQRHSWAKQFRRKGKQLLKNGIEELPTISIMRYTD